MIYLTQLIYIKEGQEDTFHEFENLVIPIISKYNGQLTLRVRPVVESYVESSIGMPYEIHIVEFKQEQDFEDFKNDKERISYLHLKEQSIKSVFLIKGTQI